MNDDAWAVFLQYSVVFLTRYLSCLSIYMTYQMLCRFVSHADDMEMHCSNTNFSCLDHLHNLQQDPLNSWLSDSNIIIRMSNIGSCQKL